MNIKEAKKICQDFAIQHKLIFEDEGECGFGRECVGLLSKSGNWLDYNPRNNTTFEPIDGCQSEDVYPPSDVEAYHKHSCMAVLGRGNEAIIGLAKWVQKLNSIGNVRIIEFETGATGMQVLISGLINYTVMVGDGK